MAVFRNRGLLACVTLASALVAEDVAAQPACTTPKTFCEGADGYYAASDDRDKMAGLTDSILKELRTCLDAAGGKHVKPVVVVRFDENGKAVTHRVEAQGYETLPCVARANAKLATFAVARETAIRCEYGCPKPQPAPVTAPPPVIAPPATTTAPAPVATVAPAPPPVPAPPPPRYEKVWYGYQTLVADAGWMALLSVGIATETKQLYTISGVAYVLATPIVHWVHGNIAFGFASMGMRIILPPVGLAIGAIAGLIIGGSGSKDALETSSGALSGLATGMVVGTIAGGLVCVAIDAAAFGWEKQRVDDSARIDLRRQKPWFSLHPTMDIQKDRASIGAAGTF